MAIIPDAPNSLTRGVYEVDELRTSLIDRDAKGAWTRMEAEIFNVVTRYWDRGNKPLFSTRLHVVSQMLKTFDDCTRRIR